MGEEKDVIMEHLAPFSPILIDMNIFQKAYCRTFQFFLNKVAMPFIKFPKQETFEGNKSLLKLPSLLKEKGYKRPFLLISNSVLKSPYGQEVVSSLKENVEELYIFNEVKQNPEFTVINKAKELALSFSADSIIAIGGGSVIDSAKALGALLANKKKTLDQFKGLLKVRKPYKMLIIAPTTAGSGSEATIASVITNPKTKDKFAINSPNILPNVVFLDDELLRSLPKNVIANTGMDALTHALEAYVGNALTKETKKAAESAVLLIHNSLYAFYSNPNDDEARKDMLKASYLAGKAFTRSYVGYVHALAHSLGGLYNVPHGYANAVILPTMLSKYDKKVAKKLSYLATLIKLNNAGDFIEYIKELNKKMGIPTKFDSLIKETDIDFLSKHAAKEANPLYPVPKEFSRKELAEIYKELD